MITEVDQQAETFQDQFRRVREEVGKVIVGVDDIIDGVLMSLLANSHVLLEGVPGLGKTKLVSTLSNATRTVPSRARLARWGCVTTIGAAESSTMYRSRSAG